MNLANWFDQIVDMVRLRVTMNMMTKQGGATIFSLFLKVVSFLAV